MFVWKICRQKNFELIIHAPQMAKVPKLSIRTISENTFEFVELAAKYRWIVINIVYVDNEPAEWCFALGVWCLHLILVLLFDCRIFQINEGFGANLARSGVHWEELIFTLLQSCPPRLHTIINMLIVCSTGLNSGHRSTNWHSFIDVDSQNLFFVGETRRNGVYPAKS